MRNLFIILLSLILFTGCAYDKPVKSQGSFTIDGVTYSFSSLRVDHVGYVPGSDSSQFILRLTGYPGTFSMDTLSHKGYGTVLQLFFIASDRDFYPGDCSTHLFPDSLSHMVTINQDGDTTALIPISDASVTVSSADNDFLSYDFSLTSLSGVTTGFFSGKHLFNQLVDQPAYGAIAFDTINTSLSSALLFRWEHLFSPDYFYYEIIFYSANSRFKDDGSLRQGVQFSLGLVSSSDLLPLDGDYVVSLDPTPGSVMYGHKVQNAHWGTYWNVFYAGSSVGKANILSGDLLGFRLEGDNVSFTFSFIDQLDDTVIGYYDGPFRIY